MKVSRIQLIFIECSLLARNQVPKCSLFFSAIFFGSGHPSVSHALYYFSPNHHWWIITWPLPAFYLSPCCSKWGRCYGGWWGCACTSKSGSTFFLMQEVVIWEFLGLNMPRVFECVSRSGVLNVNTYLQFLILTYLLTTFIFRTLVSFSLIYLAILGYTLSFKHWM